jgi:hypothetical protein
MALILVFEAGREGLKGSTLRTRSRAEFERPLVEAAYAMSVETLTPFCVYTNVSPVPFGVRVPG